MSVRRLSKTFISGAGAAAEKSSSFLANYSSAIDEMELIERVRVGSGGTSAIVFDEIPATYQHLQIRIIGRTDRASARESMDIRLNGVTTSSYAYHFIYGDGSSAAAGAGASQTLIDSFDFAGATATANIFGAAIIDILDYSNISKNTTVRVFGGADRNGAGLVAISSGLLVNTNAVSSVNIFPANGNDFVQHSTASLYGVKA